jgi:hypothetical protein
MKYYGPLQPKITMLQFFKPRLPNYRPIFDFAQTSAPSTSTADPIYPPSYPNYKFTYMVVS